MSYDLASDMRADCFRGKGPLRHYVYEWICRDTTVYVGRGVDERYDKFYTTKKYGDKERHDFVLAHKDELTCRYAVSYAAHDAAREAEALLIGHWRLRKHGGTLFNGREESRPILSDLGEDRRALALFNVPAIVPSQNECLSKGEAYPAFKESLKEGWNIDDRIVFTGARSPWPRNSKGWNFDRNVLCACLPAKFREIAEFAEESGFRQKDTNDHLCWGRIKGYIAVEAG
jgi:hypothetical protein